MLKHFKTVLLPLMLVLSAGGCVEQKHKNEGCTPETDQGLEISFYSRSRCQGADTWPAEITDILVCVFNGEGILAHHRYLAGIAISEDYSVSLPTEQGLYTVIGWAGLDAEYFDLPAPVDGETVKEDLIASIRRADGTGTGIWDHRVYMGESPAVYVEAGEAGGDYVPARVNLLEVTNRVTISVEGLPTNAEDYEITVEADNGSMTYEGEIAEDDILVYRPAFTYGNGSVEGEFTLLKLETGHNYFISVRNIVSGTELYHGSLLGALILKNPTVDLNCDHDFTIRFTAEDQCACGTYAITEIWVNNWLVHSYGTEF